MSKLTKIGNVYGFRRLATLYDRRAGHFLAFLSLAGAMLWMR